MTQKGALFLTAATAVALSATKAQRQSRFIPGSGCGTFNAVKLIDGNPTIEEETRGCIYITKDSHSKSRAKGRLEYNAVEHTPGQNKESMADKLRVDDVFEEWDQGANYWSGPKNTLPQGFTLELLGRVSLGNIVVRNARTTEWKSGTKDFEILLGETQHGPWKSVLNGSMPNTMAPPWNVPAEIRQFDITDAKHIMGRYLKFVCHAHHPPHQDALGTDSHKCTLTYLAVYGSQCLKWC